MIFSPFDHYWRVAGDMAKVFSSKRGVYVSTDDAEYQEWSADQDHAVTAVESGAALAEILSKYSLRPAEADILDGYKDAHSRRITIEVVAKVLFHLVNEIRSIKGQQTLTGPQFRAFVKDLM